MVQELAHLVTSGGGRPEDALMGISPLGAHPGGASPFATSSPAGTQVVSAAGKQSAVMLVAHC